jgi:hypothetical protein
MTKMPILCVWAAAVKVEEYGFAATVATPQEGQSVNRRRDIVPDVEVDTIIIQSLSRPSSSLQ